MLLSAYGVEIDVKDVMRDVPMLKNDKKKEWGTFGVDLARYCMKKGFDATYVSFDCLITDQKWATLGARSLRSKFAAKKLALSFDDALTKSFIRSYRNFLAEKGELLIQPRLTSVWLYRQLKRGPVIACITFAALYGRGTGTHFVVIYGNDKKGNFLIADPWEKPGRHVVEPERLISAVMAAQMTCENAVFWIRKK